MSPSPSTAVYRSPAFQGHETGGHPENPRRMAGIERELERTGLLVGRPLPAWEPATREQLARVHDERYLDLLERIVESGGGWIDADTFCGPDSLAVAKFGAGAVCDSVERSLRGEQPRAFVLCRPPGHHALAARAMGFCLLGNVAVGAAHARSLGAARVAIMDWDVHHGNGTQEMFYEDDTVLFCSVHRFGNFFPGSGSQDERGRRRGAGLTANVPLRAGRGDAEFFRAFTARFEPLVLKFQPDLILVSAGFDAHVADPLGGMRMTEAGFARLATLVGDWSESLCGGRAVAVLEGGYAPDALGRSVAATLSALDGVERGGYDAIAQG